MKYGYFFAALAFAVGGYSLATEPVVCSVAFTTGGSTRTDVPTTGVCSWPKNSTILMQCDANVYVDSSTIKQVLPTAAPGDQRIDFAAFSDPYIVFLDYYDQAIAVRGVTASGICLFMTSKRVRP
jgi:hypothetical protein